MPGPLNDVAEAIGGGTAAALREEQRTSVGLPVSQAGLELVLERNLGQCRALVLYAA